MELLVMAGDRRNPDDIFKDAKLYKRGMVIDIHPDGWNWGKEELNNPIFRIIKAQDLDSARVTALLNAEDGFGAADPATSTFQIRANKLDLDSATLPDGFRAYLNDDNRAQAFYAVAVPVGKATHAAAVPGAPQSIELTQDELLNLIVPVATVTNPLIV